MDEAAKLIGEQIIRPEHPVPGKFALPQASAAIGERNTWPIFVGICSGERLL